MAEERDRRAREAFAVAEAERMGARRARVGAGGEAVRRELGLPDAAQVTGWSRADPRKAPHDDRRALFGGWRLEEMEAKRRGPGPSTACGGPPPHAFGAGRKVR